jgi:hypothetical protein
MPERWERELRRLADVEPPEQVVVRERMLTGTRSPGGPRRRDRVAAGLLAGAVAVAAIALLVRTLPGGPARVGSADLPVLEVSFHDSEVVPEGPDSTYREVRTSITYGDATDDSFTSTTPAGAHVDWVSADALTRFVPGPTAGGPIRFAADGDDARVLLGRPEDWPNFGLFERIERLPEEPGRYVLVFAADYPEGVARTARVVDLVEPGLLQLVVEEGGDVGASTAHAYLDGRGTLGFLSQSDYSEGDLGVGTTRERPAFDDAAWLAVPSGAPVGLSSDVASARVGAFPGFDAFDPDAMGELGDHGSVIEGEAGRHLLALQVTWQHGVAQGLDGGTFERALFFFPIEIVDEPGPLPEPTEEPTGSPAPSPSVTTPPPSPVPADAIVVRIFGLGERSDDVPVITMSYRGETRRGCTEAFTWTLADGTKLDEASGRHGSFLPPCSYDPLFVVPPGVPITLESLTATEVFATRTTTPFYEGPDGFGASVRWADGRGDFTVSFEVRGAPDAVEIVLDCPRDERVEFATPDGPRILPGGSAYIRGNMGGFLQTDVIEQMTRFPGGSTEWDGVWQVVRAGSVIAAVDFSSLGGVACRGSGIGGV